MAGLLLLLGPLKGVVTACTEVKHGIDPKWTATTRGRFSCKVVGYQTTTHDLIAAGVERWEWASVRPAKQQAELLGLRTAFLDWFVKTYQELGGTRQDAINEVQYVVDAWKDNKVCVVTEHGQELRDRPK